MKEVAGPHRFGPVGRLRNGASECNLPRADGRHNGLHSTAIVSPPPLTVNRGRGFAREPP